ncbi:MULTISPECIES: pentapeptide repeat-containing protein [Cyanophyceae]|uniref:pentapeptide repeat-containing protein n=1 Tax=Cyanophyceae TaxID=3028117 RepID=UPI001686AB41|nr:pentapeptide repeat-containing protein [Trichocoleus sp. FACHB-69]MBD1934724.1 pentapeptide repeat-containing protein [Trichocoleus sp. FACHB-69]
MKPQIAATAALLATISLAVPAIAEDVQHLRQLLATKQCPQCNLSGAGFALADLSGANLSGADLSRANLSRANLTGANLAGANLSGASLFGVNLAGANLTGANLTGADLRESYLVNASMVSANVNGANFQAAIGIPNYAATAEEFYTWGVVEGQKGDQGGAIAHFNQALALKPQFAAAYFARGVARYQAGDRQGAVLDSQRAAEIFTVQGNMQGYQTAQLFIKEITTPPKQPGSGGGNLMNFLGGIGSLLLQMLL